MKNDLPMTIEQLLSSMEFHSLYGGAGISKAVVDSWVESVRSTLGGLNFLRELLAQAVAQRGDEAEFEAWAVSSGLSIERGEHLGEYTSPRTRAACLGWMESRGIKAGPNA